MLTKIDLCSRALLKLGEPAITGFDDGTAAAKVASGLYDTTIGALLTQHNWRFASQRFKLAKTSDGYFVMPPNALRVIGADVPGYEISGDKIFAPASELEITAIIRVEAGSFPPYFAALAATKLAMEFAVPLTGSQNAFAMLNALFERELTSAKFIDSASATPPKIENFSLLTTRF